MRCARLPELSRAERRTLQRLQQKALACGEAVTGAEAPESSRWTEKRMVVRLWDNLLAATGTTGKMLGSAGVLLPPLPWPPPPMLQISTVCCWRARLQGVQSVTERWMASTTWVK